MTTKVLQCVAVLALLTPMSCGKDRISAPSTDGPILADNVTVIDTLPGVRFEGVAGTAYTFVFDGVAPEVLADEIIVSGEGNGFLRRVVSVAVVDSSLILETADAALTDAVIEGGLSAAFELPITTETDGEQGLTEFDELAKLHPVILARGVSIAGQGLDLSGLELFSGSVDGVDLEVLITSGFIAFSPSIDIGLEIKNGVLDEIHTIVGGELTMNCDLTAAAAGPLIHTQETHLATFESSTIQYIGDVPVVELITLRFDAGFAAATQTGGTVNYRIGGDYDLLYGGRTHDNGWLSIWNPKVVMDGDMLARPRDIAMNIHVFVRPTITVDFYAVSGAAMSVAPFIEFAGEMTSEKDWRWVLDGGVEGQMAIDVGMIDPRAAGFSDDFGVLAETIKADSGSIINTWEVSFGGTGEDKAEDVEMTPDGGCIVVGSTQSFGAGSWDIYAVKVDPFGRLEWQRTYGGADEDYGQGVVAMPDGGFVISGDTRSFGAGDRHAYIIRTNSSGDVIWTQRFGLDITSRAIIRTADGGFLIAGRGRFKFANTAGLYLAKLDTAGALEWERTYRDIFTAASVVQLPSGEYVATGHTPSANVVDVILLKVDSVGEVIWTSSHGGSNVDFGESIVVNDDGSLLITGTSRSFTVSGTDLYLLKASAEGQTQWSRVFSGSDDAEANNAGRAIVAAHDGGHIIVGWSSIDATSSSDVYIMKITKLGVRLWQRRYGGVRTDRAEDIVPTPDGGYILAGRTTSVVSGDSDFYVLKVNERGNLNASTGIQ